MHFVSLVLCDGVQLDVEQAGSGPPLVLVHGSWAGKNTWDPVFLALAARFRVIRYDRRGYGQSQHPGGAPGVHIEDLLALLRTLGLTRSTLVGNSLGALIAMHVGLRAPELVGLVVAHEPPMLSLLERSSLIWERVQSAIARSMNAAQNGNHLLSAQIYVDDLASCPGTWEYLPEALKQGFVENARAFLDDASSLAELELTPSDLQRLGQALVVTRGDRTSPYLRLIVENLYSALPHLRRHVFTAAGHVPHQSCPADFVATTLEFAARSTH